MDSTVAMKLFQCVQNFFHMLSIHPSQHHQGNPFNPKNILIILLFATAFVSSTAALTFQAKSVKEFGDAFCGLVTELASLVFFLSLIQKMSAVQRLIEKFDGLVQKSKLSDFELCGIHFIRLEDLNYNTSNHIRYPRIDQS